MTANEAISVLDILLQHQSPLTDIQELVFYQAWEGKSYAEIADEAGYEHDYIRCVGSKLWKLISQVVGRKVTKNNLHITLKGCRQQIAPQYAFKSQDWGEAVNVSYFWGREAEIASLQQWIIKDRCSLIAILGIGGVGKTALSVKLARTLQEQFEYAIWRSLRDAPPAIKILSDIVKFISHHQTELPAEEEGIVSLLIKHLQQHRCLIVLDNFETVLDSDRCGRYRSGNDGYGEMLRRLGEVAHQSCLILTSREKPQEIVALEGEILPVRSLQLQGLEKPAAQEILKAKGLNGDEKLNQLVNCYAGNPLALKIAATSIQELFAGDVAEFLAQDIIVFNGIRQLLKQQFQRLSELEAHLMYWLAICREPVSVGELQLVLKPAKARLLEALEFLRRRSLIEISHDGYTQQPVVMEYVTERFCDRIYQEITTARLNLFCTHALILAQAKDYVREAQIRLILKPVAERLTAAEEHLKNLLATLREQPQAGYAGGNLLNLLWQLQIDLTGWNFSWLTIRQAYLPRVNLHQTDFTGADLNQSVFADTFGGITAVAFSPDGSLLATGHTDGKFNIWRAADGQQLITGKSHGYWVWLVAFSPDGHTLATAGDDCRVRLWSVDTGKCLHTFAEHTYTVTFVAFSPDGQTLASSSQDATIRLWNISGLSEGSFGSARTFSGHDGRVWSVAFSPDGRTLASCGEDQTIKLWDLATDACRSWQAHDAWVKSVAFSPNGQMLASGSFDSTIKLWDLSGTCVQTLRGHSSTVTTVAFSPNGQRLASSSYDQTLRLWHLSAGRCTSMNHKNRVWSVAFSPDGQRLASGGDDHAAKIWNLKGQCYKTVQGHTSAILSLSLSPDRQFLASGHEDQTVKIWNLKTGQRQVLRGHTNRVWSVAFSPDGQYLASGSGDRTIKLWRQGQYIQTLQGHKGWVWSMAFSPDGQYLASGSYDRTIKIWDVRTGECLHTQEHSLPVVTVEFSPDGEYLANSSFDQTIRLWNFKSEQSPAVLGQGWRSLRQCSQILEDPPNYVWSIVFSPCGQYLASSSYDGTIKLWALKTGQPIQTFAGHQGPVVCLAFSSFGQYLASGSYDHTLKLWNLEGQCLRTFYGHTDLIPALIYCDQLEQATIVTSSFDETIKFWSLDGECLRTFRDLKPYEGMNITGVKGLTEAQRATLQALGAVESV